MKDNKFEKILEENLTFNEKNKELDEKIIMESKEKTGSYKLYILKTAIAACLVLFVSLTAVLNLSKTIAEAAAQIPYVGKICSALTFREYVSDDLFSSAHISIPKVEGLGKAEDKLNEEISTYLEGIIKEYEAISEEMKEFVAEDSEGALEGSQTFNFDIKASYDVLCDTDKYFSIKINTAIVMAGAQEMNKIFTVDKEAEKIITLEDIYGENYKEIINNKVKEQMEKEMAADETLAYFPESLEFYEPSFYVTEKGEAVVSYDKFTVAAGFMGVCEFNLGII